MGVEGAPDGTGVTVGTHELVLVITTRFLLPDEAPAEASDSSVASFPSAAPTTQPTAWRTSIARVPFAVKVTAVASSQDSDAEIEGEPVLGGIYESYVIPVSPERVRVYSIL